MKSFKTKIEDVIVIEPNFHNDNRGYFMESYSKEEYSKIGIKTEFVQDNISFSLKKEH